MILNIPTNGNVRLIADVSLWSGLETVELDGTVVSHKSSYTYSTPHFFDRLEDGK